MLCRSATLTKTLLGEMQTKQNFSNKKNQKIIYDGTKTYQ